MNRVSLLHILDHASGISEAEVRELEQLAAAFPYCQTAHLLLAKAAHDRGSMLAGQRLRRAATYAADRELLRALIELRPATPAAVDSSAPLAEPTTSAASLTEAPAPPATPEAPAPLEAELPEAAQIIFSEAEAAELPTDAPPVLQPEAAAAPPLAQDFVAPETAEVAAAAQQVAELEPENQEPAQTESGPKPAALPELAATTDEQPEPAVSTETVAQPSETNEVPAESAELAPAETPEAPTQAEPAEQPAAEPLTATAEQPTPESTVEAASPTEVAEAEASATADATLLPSSAVIAELAVPAVALMPLPGTDGEVAAEELPAAAPPIRPPVEAGSSRFEFGLGDAPEAGPAYQLPELPEASAPTGIPAYRADELLAYALSSGSRFGAALTLRAAELTSDLPTADAWHPDAPVLAHYAAHRPAAPAVPSSLALIDKFLRSQPRIKSAQRPAPTDAPQADLSVRSTSTAPSLASESLAKIMVKQGKIGRAIEIYEQLMQRQPEKKAYFAAQIDLLTQQPE